LHLLFTVADIFLIFTTSSASQTSAEDDTEFEDDILDTIVPDLFINVTESELLQCEIEQQQNFDFELFTMNTVSVNERADLLILNSVFSTLFSTGKADFALSQSHSVKLSDYAKHLLKYKNDQFN